MEISFRYILIQLDGFLHPIFALIYLSWFSGDVVGEKIVIEDRVRIWTGICISIYYIYKFILLMRVGHELKDLTARITKMEKQKQADLDNSLEDLRTKRLANNAEEERQKVEL